MSRIVGIIYPNVLPATDMSHPGSAQISPESICKFRHKNLEIKAFNAHLRPNDKKTIWAIVDGEIYNASQLRVELQEMLGYQFRTQSVEEVIVHAYDAWREECLKRFKGPFALAVFDEENETLLLARDRMGQKPLYWTTQGNHWLFSTHLKMLLSTGLVPQTPSLEALGAYLSFGFVPQDLAMIHHVNKLLPGYYLKVNLSRQILIEQFWSYSSVLEDKCALSLEETYQQLSQQFQEIFSLLPQADIIGASLDGHLGFTAMAEHLDPRIPNHRFHFYSAYFQSTSSDELKVHAQIANTWSRPLLTKGISASEVLEELPALLWHLEEPLADPSILLTWNLAQLAASSGSNIFYSSTGWEEIFGADRQPYLDKQSVSFLLARSPAPFRDICLLPLLGLISTKYKYRLLRESAAPLAHACPYPPLFNGRERKKISPTLASSFDPEIFSQRFHKLASIGGSIAPVLYYEAKTKLPDSTLFQYEKLFETQGVRVVHPYLFPDLVEFMARLPDTIKFEGKMPAPLLSSFIQKKYPDFVLPPENEPSFMEKWRNEKLFRDTFLGLSKGRLVEEGFISAKWIKQQLGYPYLIPSNFHQLWALLVLEIWFRIFIDEPVSDFSPLDRNAIREKKAGEYLEAKV